MFQKNPLKNISELILYSKPNWEGDVYSTEVQNIMYKCINISTLSKIQKFVQIMLLFLWLCYNLPKQTAVSHIFLLMFYFFSAGDTSFSIYGNFLVFIFVCFNYNKVWDLYRFKKLNLLYLRAKCNYKINYSFIIVTVPCTVCH